MLSTIFESIVSMSISASIVIAAVCLVRLLLRRGPRRFCYVLWLAVLIRLLCPFTFTAQVEVEREQLDRELVAVWAEYSAGVQLAENETVREDAPAGGFGFAEILPVIWAAGIAAMLAYCTLSLLKLRRRLAIAAPLGDGVYIADHIGAPFVVGFVHPKIYLPSDLREDEREYILAHERHHIRRGDHFAKLLGFAALSLHWFNPLAWVAFRLFVKDMEASCDEAVLAKLGGGVRADYSQSLLDLAVGRRMPAWTPLTFAEDTKGRIENVLRWHRPSLRRVVSAALVTAVCVGCCFVSVEGVMAEEQYTGELSGVDLGSIKSGIIVRTPDPKGYENLTEGQVETLTALLRLADGQTAQQAEELQASFAITLRNEAREGIIIRFGHNAGQRCLTVNGYVVEDELLTAGAYHIYLSFGTQNLCGESLPEGAVLLRQEHGVYIYEFYCESCGQMETASVGHACDCCSYRELDHKYSTLDH